MSEEQNDDRSELKEHAPSETLPPSAPSALIEEPTAEERHMLEAKQEAEVRRQMSRRTRRSFLVGAGAAIVGAATWKWADSRPPEDGVAWPFRRALQWNDRLAQAYFNRGRLSPSFSPRQVTRNRVNGHIGLSAANDPASWTLSLLGVAGMTTPLILTMKDILALPHRNMITELRCIEGWSIVVKWTGVRLLDLMVKYPPATRDGSAPDVVRASDRLVRFAAMETADRAYYVGLDMASASHPQTLLAFAMNDQPLSWEHGAPLRLAIPVKYGIKNIKRIGTIRYSDVRPADFWAERGYDWYAGH